MKTAIVGLRSVSPYSQSRHYTVDKLPRELARDYEARTWRERLHVNSDGNVFIPPMAFKNALSEAAKFLSMPVPGKGKATYTKNIEAGILVPEGVDLGIRAADVEGEWLFLPSDGKRGSGKRVDKCFPLIRQWSGHVTFLILDEIVTREVFAEHIELAGKFIGIGRFRPRNNGFYGRFVVESLDWK